MTNVEFIKYLIFGDTNSTEIEDTLIENLIQSFGFNGAICYIAMSEKNKLSSEATSVNDGANSFSFGNKMSGLDDIIKQAEKYAFVAPEGDGEEIPAYWASDMQGEKDHEYF